MTFFQKFLIVVALAAVTALIVAVTMRSDHLSRRAPRPGVSAWLAAVSVALLLVGIVTETLFRHVIQIAPVFVALALGVRRSQLNVPAALPALTFWFFAMGGIWLTLLGIAPVFTGRYGTAEIVLTVVIGLASAGGVIAVVRQGTTLSLGPRLATVLAFAILQPLAVMLSF